jgi:Calx-beta domain-containing protein/VCBS repeat protein
MKRPKRLRFESLDDRCLLSFSPAGTYASGAYTPAVISADFDNDNVPDLATSNGAVLLGNGDGTFRSVPNSGAAGGSIAVGDFDGDGNVDLAVSTYSTSVTVLMGQGDGTFVAAGDLSVENGVSSVAVGDFTGDGLLDLGVTSNVYIQDGYDPYYGSWGHFEGSVHVLVSNGGGDFSAPITTWLGYGYLEKSAVGDFNRDGIGDLAATDTYTDAVHVLFGDAGGFVSGPVLYANTYVPSLAVADVNGDLNPDIVTGNYGSGSNIEVRLGDGSGGFGPPQYNGPGAAPYSVTAADFNGDSKLDIASTSYFTDNSGIYTGYISVLLGKGDGTFHSTINQNLAPGPGTYILTAADFDGDGLPDVAVTGSPGPASQIDILLNAGDWVVPTTLTIGDVTVTEGDTGTVEAAFTVTRGDNLNTAVTVNYATANAEALAGSDYVATSGTLTFAPGETSKQIKVLVKGDLTDEYDQHFYVNLSAASGATVLDSLGVGTIVDNDPPPTITITSKVSGKEGNKNSTTITFVVTLSAPSEKEVRVNYATANGTASTVDSDYIARSGTLVFAAGQTGKNIAVTVRGDKKKEANETFFVNLSDATNATIVGSQGVGEILNDDPR